MKKQEVLKLLKDERNQYTYEVTRMNMGLMQNDPVRTTQYKAIIGELDYLIKEVESM